MMIAETEITADIAANVLRTIDAGLVAGTGKPIPGQMCVMAAINYAMGLPHGDKAYYCDARALRQLKIGLNDANWSSPAVRARGMRRVAIVSLGSAGCLDEREFARRVVEHTIRVVVPAALSLVSGGVGASRIHGGAYAVVRAVNDDLGVEIVAYRAASIASIAAAHVSSGAGDAILSDFAEAVVQILIDMGAPGCQWLPLTEAA